MRVEETLARIRSRLASARERAGLSREELADRLGTSPRKVDDWMSGRAEMSVSELVRFARATGRPAGWFLGEEPRGMTVEAAESGLRNLARIRLCLEALEELLQGASGVDLHPRPPASPARVVTLDAYRRRAREILERRASSEEERAAIDEGSVEMVAIGLYEAERQR